jgi:hypothetical protein
MQPILTSEICAYPELERQPPAYPMTVLLQRRRGLDSKSPWISRQWLAEYRVAPFHSCAKPGRVRKGVLFL